MQAGGRRGEPDRGGVLWRCGGVFKSHGGKAGHVLYLLSVGERIYGEADAAAYDRELSVRGKRKLCVYAGVRDAVCVSAFTAIAISFGSHILLRQIMIGYFVINLRQH